jgi:uncharacterized protein
MLEHKTHPAPAQLKADFSQRTIEGYASVFGNVDLTGDVVVSGAFKKTLADRLPRKLVKVYYDHYVPIGMPVRAEEDGTGLFTVSKVSAVPEGDKVLQFVADGLCAHMSFAYDVVRREYIEPTDALSTPIRRLLELKLYEFGPVHFPANEQAEILSVKELSEALRAARAAVPRLAELMGKKGFLRDPEIDLVQHLGAAITKAVADSIKALSEAQPDPAADDADAATTGTSEPPPTTGDGVTDPEAVLYAGIEASLAALQMETSLASLRAAAH